MTARPRLLDLFCGAGGAGYGYHLAGFRVTGVDIAPQSHHWDHACVVDALEVLDYLIGDPGDEYDVVHASPPCQAYTTMSNRWRGAGGKADEHLALIDEVRERLIAYGRPYVIENVPGARPVMRSPFLLHGGMFGLRVFRPRLFECSELVFPPAPALAPKDPVGVYGKLDGRRVWTRTDGSEQRAAATLEEAREAMGMPWADWHGCKEAIPPAYTEFIGGQLLASIGAIA